MTNPEDRVPTAFEERVYDWISMIPRGCVATYALVGKGVQCGSAQAIGQALKRNPGAPAVPCHRVIKSDLTLGGYSGARSGPEVERKIRLLKAEGVEFDAEGRLLDEARVWTG